MLYRRQARASLYLDKMIAPMLEPSEIELRDLWRTGTTPFKDLPFDRVIDSSRGGTSGSA